MTDGCSFINKAGLLRLQLHFQWKSFPTAVQCRLGGTKVIRRHAGGSFLCLFSSQGLLSLHPDMNHPAQGRPTVWIRPSQVKIKYPSSEEPDPARLIIDIVQPSHMKSGRLKSETLINLAENGVPHDVLIKLLQEGLDEHVAGLIKWEGEEAMLNLWCNLAHKGRVMSFRKARQAAGEARARGYDYTKLEDEEADEDDLEDAADMLGQSSTWWLDEVLCCTLNLLYYCLNVIPRSLAAILYY
jgi:RNA-dependent RNA polymerase